jgi:hypothetical protein
MPMIPIILLQISLEFQFGGIFNKFSKSYSLLETTNYRFYPESLKLFAIDHP